MGTKSAELAIVWLSDKAPTISSLVFSNQNLSQPVFFTSFIQMKTGKNHEVKRNLCSLKLIFLLLLYSCYEKKIKLQTKYFPACFQVIFKIRIAWFISRQFPQSNKQSESQSYGVPITPTLLRDPRFLS